MTLDEDVQLELAELAAQHRLRTPRIVDTRQGTRVTLDGHDVLNFASNDYLSLAGDERLARAAASAAVEAGTGAGASRLIVGNHRQHVQLENELADWLRTPSSRLFNSGFAANVGVLTTLLRPGDVVFSDELNHASIIDGCRLSRAEVVVYPHLDHAALARELAIRTSARRRIVVSETLFSMDGDIADVVALASVAHTGQAALVLDEAHAIGVYGPEGRGIAAACGVVPDVLVGTCGKALGSFGAFAACSSAIASLLWTRARPLVFSTGLPPHVCAASRAALAIIRGSDGEDARVRLRANTSALRRAVPALRGATDSPIAPLLVGDDRKVMQMTADLLEPRGPDASRFYVQGIRPPTVPEGGARLRVSLAAGHTPAQVEALAARLQSFT